MVTNEVIDNRSDAEKQQIAELESLFQGGFDEVDKILGEINADVKAFQGASRTFTYRPSGYLSELDAAYESQKVAEFVPGDSEGSPDVKIMVQTLNADFMAQVTGIVTRLDTENEQNKFLIEVLKEKDKLLGEVINRTSAVNMIVTRMQRLQSLVNKQNVEMQAKIMATLTDAINISQTLYTNTNIIATQFAELFNLMSETMTTELKNFRIRINIAQKISNQRVKAINTDINYVAGALKATNQVLTTNVRELILDVKHQQDSAIQAAGHLTQLKLKRLSGALFSASPTYKNVIDGAGTSALLGFIVGAVAGKAKENRLNKARSRYKKGAI